MIRPIVVDSGILIIFATGYIDSSNCDIHKRTREYGMSGFEHLMDILSFYDKVIITPQILAETWNLAGNEEDTSSPGGEARLALKTLSPGFLETFNPSADLCGEPEFMRLGFSDTAQLIAAQRHACPIITLDKQLWLAALNRGLDAIHFGYEFRLARA
jgi:hypothetical protein